MAQKRERPTSCKPQTNPCRKLNFVLSRLTVPKPASAIGDFQVSHGSGHDLIKFRLHFTVQTRPAEVVFLLHTSNFTTIPAHRVIWHPIRLCGPPHILAHDAPRLITTEPIAEYARPIRCIGYARLFDQTFCDRTMPPTRLESIANGGSELTHSTVLHNQSLMRSTPKETASHLAF